MTLKIYNSRNCLSHLDDKETQEAEQASTIVEIV